MGTFLLYLSLGLVILWTVRLAQSKGRNPWIWGLAALLLMLFPGQILGMAPMLVLLFLRKSAGPQTDEGQDQGNVTCPRCHTGNSTSHQYCVNCGWELAKPYQEHPADRQGEAPPAPVEEKARPKSTADTAQEVATETPAPEAPSYSSPAVEAEEAPPPQDPAPEEQPVANVPVFRVMPTAPNLTERGMALFNQGRYQEAIDQFTKAIALNPGYKSAWEHRAEAYERLGRRKEAAEDMRRLEAI